MMNSLQLRQSLRLELKKLEHYKDCKSLQDMFSSEQYISKAKKYCDLLHEFAEGNKKYDRLFDVLDCLELDSNYSLALHLANKKIFFGDVSWFYCYEGDNDIYQDLFNHPDSEKEEDFFQCFGNLSEFDIFDHLYVERSEMGAWQAYLLSIAVSQLPVIWHGAYRKEVLIFSNEDIMRCHPDAKGGLFFQNKSLNLTYPEEELLPNVWFEGNTANVRSCYFNLWKGVVRRTTTFSFDHNKVSDFSVIKSEVLYEYDCRFKL